MSKGFKNGPVVLLAACSILFLPCCLVLCLDLYPGTTYKDHWFSAVQLLAAGSFLVLRPLPAQARDATLPEEHRDQLLYALRSGVLPLASLFSDWRDELARQGRAYSLALRVLPTGTASVILLEVYGLLCDPAGHLFFLACAVAAASFGLAAFGFSAVRLGNIRLVENKLRDQIRLLDALL